jgi:hypothetical protein
MIGESEAYLIRRTGGGWETMRKVLYEELIIHIGKDEMARLLDLDDGYAVQQIEPEGEDFRLIFSRKIDLSAQSSEREERRRFL